MPGAGTTGHRWKIVCQFASAATSMDRQARDAQRETGNRIPHMLTGCFRGYASH
ncbi:hypothetical protein TGAMA5MH_07211 [Trichoderma gamsii]|uniref:Uncharacterized protein n=1 Tax=Trichoderma gamsii TaxID=398673 RepID=A0A2K0T5G5_9HYPO|nr:hypothetical protein TGAMA5MH_07211 [Trichoderma gamsii]